MPLVTSWSRRGEVAAGVETSPILSQLTNDPGPSAQGPQGRRRRPGSDRRDRRHPLLQEAFRQCKVLGAWADGARVLTDAGVDTTAPGMLVGTGTKAAVKAFNAELMTALGLHRVWERASLLAKPA